MKTFIWDTINKIGVDKILHFLVGALITFIIGNIFGIQDTVIPIMLMSMTGIGVLVTLILEFIKEYVIDGTPDWNDILATFLGCLVPILTNAIVCIL